MKWLLLVITTFFYYSATAQNIPEYVFSGGKVVLGKNVYQSDVGFNISRLSKQNRVDYKYQFGQYVNLKYGVSTKAHIYLNYNFSRTLSYVSENILKTNNSNNINIGYKHAFWDNISLQAVLGMNTHFSDATNYNLQLQAIAEHGLNDRLTWQNNLGLASNFNSLQLTANYLSGLTYSFPRPLDIIFEVFGNVNEISSSHFCNLGLGYYFSRDFMTEIYIGYGESSSNPNTFGSINLYYRIVPKSD